MRAPDPGTGQARTAHPASRHLQIRHVHRYPVPRHVIPVLSCSSSPRSTVCHSRESGNPVRPFKSIAYADCTSRPGQGACLPRRAPAPAGLFRPRKPATSTPSARNGRAPIKQILAPAFERGQPYMAVFSISPKHGWNRAAHRACAALSGRPMFAPQTGKQYLSRIDFSPPRVQSAVTAPAHRSAPRSRP